MLTTPREGCRPGAALLTQIDQVEAKIWRVTLISGFQVLEDDSGIKDYQFCPPVAQTGEEVEEGWTGGGQVP